MCGYRAVILFPPAKNFTWSLARWSLSPGLNWPGVFLSGFPPVSSIWMRHVYLIFDYGSPGRAFWCGWNGAPAQAPGSSRRRGMCLNFALARTRAALSSSPFHRNFPPAHSSGCSIEPSLSAATSRPSPPVISRRCCDSWKIRLPRISWNRSVVVFSLFLSVYNSSCLPSTNSCAKAAARSAPSPSPPPWTIILSAVASACRS